MSGDDVVEPPFVPHEPAFDVKLLDHDAATLLALLDNLSVESRHHLASALSAARTPGVGGVLAIVVPKRVGEHAQVKWAGGGKVQVELS